MDDGVRNRRNAEIDSSEQKQPFAAAFYSFFKGTFSE